MNGVQVTDDAVEKALKDNTKVNKYKNVLDKINRHELIEYHIKDGLDTKKKVNGKVVVKENKWKELAKYGSPEKIKKQYLLLELNFAQDVFDNENVAKERQKIQEEQKGK